MSFDASSIRLPWFKIGTRNSSSFQQRLWWYCAYIFSFSFSLDCHWWKWQSVCREWRYFQSYLPPLIKWDVATNGLFYNRSKFWMSDQIREFSTGFRFQTFAYFLWTKPWYIDPRLLARLRSLIQVLDRWRKKNSHTTQR